VNKGPCQRESQSADQLGDAYLRLGLLSSPPGYQSSGRRSNTPIEERRRKVTWTEGEIGKAAAKDNTVGEAKDAIGTASGAAASGIARALRGEERRSRSSGKG
jgi:hypothetical protein